jgi:hypothetical protein
MISLPTSKSARVPRLRNSNSRSSAASRKYGYVNIGCDSGGAYRDRGKHGLREHRIRRFIVLFSSMERRAWKNLEIHGEARTQSPIRHWWCVWYASSRRLEPAQCDRVKQMYAFGNWYTCLSTTFCTPSRGPSTRSQSFNLSSETTSRPATCLAGFKRRMCAS